MIRKIVNCKKCGACWYLDEHPECHKCGQAEYLADGDIPTDHQARKGEVRQETWRDRPPLF